MPERQALVGEHKDIATTATTDECTGELITIDSILDADLDVSHHWYHKPLLLQRPISGRDVSDRADIASVFFLESSTGNDVIESHITIARSPNEL